MVSVREVEGPEMLRCLGERSLEHGKDIYKPICFLNYEKAFDRVNWLKLMEALELVGINKRDRDLIKNLYMNKQWYSELMEKIQKRPKLEENDIQCRQKNSTYTLKHY